LPDIAKSDSTKTPVIATNNVSEPANDQDATQAKIVESAMSQADHSGMYSTDPAVVTGANTAFAGGGNHPTKSVIGTPDNMNIATPIIGGSQLPPPNNINGLNGARPFSKKRLFLILIPILMCGSVFLD
jgi:hypothetical protein